MSYFLSVCFPHSHSLSLSLSLSPRLSAYFCLSLSLSRNFLCLHFSVRHWACDVQWQTMLSEVTQPRFGSPINMLVFKILGKGHMIDTGKDFNQFSVHRSPCRAVCSGNATLEHTLKGGLELAFKKGSAIDRNSHIVPMIISTRNLRCINPTPSSKA